MSSIVLSPGATGAAAFTIEAPSTATSRVITLPDATDTLVGKATTDTLTNKSIVATQLTGTVAAARLPAGSLLQVVSATTTAGTSTSSTSYVATSLTASIAPSNSANKVLVLVSGGEMDSNGIGQSLTATIYRGASNLAGASGMSDSYGTSSRIQSTLSCSILDSPATTSSTTYAVYIKANTGTVIFNANAVQACITLMEVVA